MDLSDEYLKQRAQQTHQIIELVGLIGSLTNIVEDHKNQIEKLQGRLTSLEAGRYE